MGVTTIQAIEKKHSSVNDSKTSPWRPIYYARLGMSLSNAPITFLSFLTIFYYNVVVNIPILSDFLNHFYIFVIVGASFAFLFFGGVGYLYRKRTGGYKEQRKVDVESDPYSNYMVPPVALALWESWIILMEQHKHDPKLMGIVKQILINSGSKRWKLVDSKIIESISDIT